MLCRGCNKEIKDDSVFCKHCGRNVQKDSERSFCVSCGKKLDGNSNFCAYCGTPVQAEGETHIEEPGTPLTGGNGTGSKNKGETIKNGIIIALAVIIALSASISLFRKYKDSKETSSKYTDSEPGEGEAIDGDITGGDTNGGKTGGGETDGGGGKGAEKPINVNGIYYKLSDTTLIISGEGELDKKTIDSLAKKSFNSVIFESGSINIPSGTFSGYSNLKNVELRNTVNKIGAKAFKGCGFNLIAIGKSVSEIGDDAFADCAISEVYLNNPGIRANLNNRTDFGRLFENASIIAIYYSTSQSPDEDFTLDESGWGKYLKDNPEYSNLKSIYSRAISLTKKHYDLWAHATRPGFFRFNYGTGIESERGLGGDKYDHLTNTFTPAENNI